MSKSVRPFVTLCDLLRGDRRLSFVSHSVISVVDLMSGSTGRAVTVYQDVPA
jgi:hypothetical protein